MKKRFKTLISLLLSLCCLVSVWGFSGCSALTDSSAMAINGVNISDDVFTYFLDSAVVELGASSTFDKALDRAKSLAATYFKTNTLAHNFGITLSTAEKAAVSEKVGAHWSIYGQYFEKIGVSRETLTKVFTAESYRDSLVLHYYGEGGEKEISQSRLYAQFYTNYIVFQVITGYFTTTNTNGQTVQISENDKEALLLKFQNMCTMVNAAEQTMEEAADYLAGTGYNSSVQTVVLSKNDTSYPSGFFDKIQDVEPRTATVIGTSDYIFLVLKGDADMNSSYFNEKRVEMIEIIVGEEINETIENALTTDVQVANSTARGYYSIIADQKNLVK